MIYQRLLPLYGKPCEKPFYGIHLSNKYFAKLMAIKICLDIIIINKIRSKYKKYNELSRISKKKKKNTNYNISSIMRKSRV